MSLEVRMPLCILLSTVPVSVAFLKSGIPCETVLSFNCDGFFLDSDQRICDQYGYLYRTHCHFNQAWCRDQALDIDYTFSCLQNPKPPTTPTTTTTTATTISTKPSTTTTQKPSTTLPTTTTPTPSTTVTVPTTTLLTVLSSTRSPGAQAFCDYKDIIKCREDPIKVCGSDNNTYANTCEFAKVQCDKPVLTIQFHGDCQP